jgi:hypothetical protein
MSSVTSQISISLDGFVAGPNQGVENPIGEGGTRLHEWGFATESWRTQHGRQVPRHPSLLTRSSVTGRSLPARSRLAHDERGAATSREVAGLASTR